MYICITYTLYTIFALYFCIVGSRISADKNCIGHMEMHSLAQHARGVVWLNTTHMCKLILSCVAHNQIILGTIIPGKKLNKTPCALSHCEPLPPLCSDNLHYRHTPISLLVTNDNRAASPKQMNTKNICLICIFNFRFRVRVWHYVHHLYKLLAKR